MERYGYVYESLSDGSPFKRVVGMEAREDGTWVKYADAQATAEALQAVIRQMGEQAAVLTKDGMAAKAQVEALQRERDEARHTADVYQKLYGTAVMDRAIVHNEKADLQAALDAERASGGRER